MIELIEKALADMYDALMRGICLSISIGVGALITMLIVKHVGTAIKHMGLL